MMPPKKNLNFFLAAFFFSGLLPAPGTMASALCCIFVLLFPSVFNFYSCLFISAVLTMLSFFVIPPVLKHSRDKDPSEIVIDEAAGQFIALAACYPLCAGDAVWVLSAFALFRVFDILKPWPVSSLEKLPGALGIMADDLFCGLMVFVVLKLVLFFSLGI